MVRNGKNLNTVTRFRSETQALNSWCSLDYARSNQPVMFLMICASHQKYTSMLEKSTYLQVIPRQSTQNRHNQWTFLMTPHWRRNNFTNLGSFAKVFIPLGSIIPWSNILFAIGVAYPIDRQSQIKYKDWYYLLLVAIIQL